MKKQKKITIKPYLNPDVQPEAVQHASDGSVTQLYPLYYLITYNRRNQKMRSRYGTYYTESELSKPHVAKIIEFESSVIQRIIRLGANPDTQEFDMRGLNHKFEVYSESVRNVLGKRLFKLLKGIIGTTGHHLTEVLLNVAESVDFILLLEAAEKLIPDLKERYTTKLKDGINAFKAYDHVYPSPILDYDFHTLIGWADESERAEFVTALEPLATNQRKKALDYIDKVVEERLMLI